MKGPNAVLNNNRGIALIITLAIISLLVAMTFELNRQIRGGVEDAANARDRLELTNMIESGVTIAQSLLIADKADSEVDSIQEDWANPLKIEEVLAQTPFDEGSLSLFISDELSRIQVNALVAFPDGREFNPVQRDLWFRFMALILSAQEDENAFMEDVTDPSEIVNPVKDWLDSDDNDTVTGLNGAEDEYYQDLDPPYSCRNGPIRHIEELTRIKNITPELFYSSSDILAGISQYMSVFGATAANNRFTFEGKININTADIPVIAAMLPIGQEFLAAEIAAYREEKSEDQFLHELTSPTWYKEVPGAGDVEIDPGLITTQSDIFRIECSGTLHDRTANARVIVMREKNSETGKWYCRVISWVYE